MCRAAAGASLRSSVGTHTDSGGLPTGAGGAGDTRERFQLVTPSRESVGSARRRLAVRSKRRHVYTNRRGDRGSRLVNRSGGCCGSETKIFVRLSEIFLSHKPFKAPRRIRHKCLPMQIESRAMQPFVRAFLVAAGMRSIPKNHGGHFAKLTCWLPTREEDTRKPFACKPDCCGHVLANN
jgi:hypothetical protein